MAIHEILAKEYEEVYDTTSIPQYNSQSARKINKLFDNLVDQCFSIQKQIDKELLQGRNIPKKLRKWMKEADLLKSQVRDIHLLGEGLIEDEEAVEMGTKIINHLNHCPLVGELVYRKPINVTRMTEKSFGVEISVDHTENVSIFELGKNQIFSSGRGNIVEEASSVHGKDILLTDHSLYVPSHLKLHSEQRSKLKFAEGVVFEDEKTDTPHSLVQQKAGPGTPNEKMLISMGGFDTKHEIYVEQTDFTMNSDVSVEFDCKSDPFPVKDLCSASILELGNELYIRGNILEEASSGGNDVLVSENTPPYSDSSSIFKLHIEQQRSIAKITDELTNVDLLIQQEVELCIPNEKMLVSTSDFDPKYEGESSTCREAVRAEMNVWTK